MALNFGDNLKKIRTEKNISQSELAEILGMHATHLSRYERNVSAPSIEILKKIADKLNVTTDMLIYGSTDDKAKTNIKDNELLGMFAKIQTLEKSELNCVKSLLKAYIFQKDIQHQFSK